MQSMQPMFCTSMRRVSRTPTVVCLRRALSTAVARRPATASSSGWAALRLSPEACTAAGALGLHSPSAVQSLAIPAVLRGRSVAFAGATGSGKTMAFLLPVLEQLRAHEIANPAVLGPAERHRPRALVLAPTRDLAVQIGLVAKQLSHKLRVRVQTLAGGQLLGRQRDKLERGADLLVATPERLLKLVRQGELSLRRVRHVVVDEADEMLERGFRGALDEVLKRCPAPRPQAARWLPMAAAEEEASAVDDGDDAYAYDDDDDDDDEVVVFPQMVFASATLPAAVRHDIARGWPHAAQLLSACAHRSPRNLRHEMVHVAGGVDKLEELLRLVAAESDGGGVAGDTDDGTGTGAAMTTMTAAAGRGDGGADAPRRTMVFCRGVQSCRAVQHALTQAGHVALGCHSQMPEATRRAALAAFMGTAATATPPPRHPRRESGGSGGGGGGGGGMAAVLGEPGGGAVAGGASASTSTTAAAAATNDAFLVCTDVAARGLDMPAVSRVLNFDFPASLGLYIHRAGRTARMGAPGVVTTLVTPRARSLADAIEAAVADGGTLHAVQPAAARHGRGAGGASAAGAASGARGAVGLAPTPHWALATQRGRRSSRNAPVQLDPGLRKLGRRATARRNKAMGTSRRRG